MGVQFSNTISINFLKNQTQTVRLRETELSAFTFICWVCACVYVCVCKCRVEVVKMCSPEFDISFTQQNHCRIPSIMLMPSYLPSTLKCKTDGIRPFLALSCQCVQRHLKHTVYIYFLHLNTRNNFLVFFLVITISGIFQTMICHDGWRFSKLCYFLSNFSMIV